MSELNIFNKMIAALYIRYRKKETHFLSALWAKGVFGIIITFITIGLFELFLFYFKNQDLKVIVAEFYYFIFMGVWIMSIFLVYQIGINNKKLLEVDLTPEDYIRGNWLAFLFLFLSLGFLITIMFCTE